MNRDPSSLTGQHWAGIFQNNALLNGFVASREEGELRPAWHPGGFSMALLDVYVLS
jgi:hypothetical protein